MPNTLRPGTIDRVTDLGYGATAEATQRLVLQGRTRELQARLEELLRDADLPGGDAERGGMAATAMARDLEIDLTIER